MAVNVMLMMDEVHLVKYNPMMKQVVGDSYHGWIDNSEADEDHGEQDGSNVECDPTFEANCSSSNYHLVIQRHLNELLRDLYLSKKQAEFSGSRLKGVIFSPNTEICFFRNRQNEFK